MFLDLPYDVWAKLIGYCLLFGLGWFLLGFLILMLFGDSIDEVFRVETSDEHESSSVG